MSWRPNRVSLSPLDVDPLGHAQWHSVLVIICIAARVPAVVGSALRARWSSTMAPSTVALRVRHVARNSKSPDGYVSYPSYFPLVQHDQPNSLRRLQHTCTLLDTSAYLEEYPALDFVSHSPDLDCDYETDNAEVCANFSPDSSH